MSSDFKTSINMTVRQLAVALGGDVVGRFQVNVPGPGHTARDRSLSVKIDPRAPRGFTTYSHAGDHFATCRDHVIARLGLGGATPGVITLPSKNAASEEASLRHQRVAHAANLWNAAVPAYGTVVETYLKSRGLELPDDNADTIRFHRACPWRCPTTGQMLYVPAMLAAMRNTHTEELTAVHRTRLSPRGVKLGRRMLGIATAAAVMFDDHLAGRLYVGEGIESCIAARQMGLGPVWAGGSAEAIAKLPVMFGVTDLIVLGEAGKASAAAVAELKARWAGGDRKVSVAMPPQGDDFNDALILAQGARR